MKIAVAGGTGLVGGMVVDALRAAGHTPVVLARSVGVDVTTGAGLAEALSGTHATIDVTNVTTMKAQESIDFFSAATSNLLAHSDFLLSLSIVGVDRVDLPYYLGKRRQEELLLATPDRTAVLRATQFHEFPGQLLQRGGGRLAMIPRMRSQPIAAREVADALVAAVTAPQRGMLPELAGPEVHAMPALARRLVKARHVRCTVVPLPVPGRLGRQLSGGGLLPEGTGPRGVETFSGWLARVHP
jgi:uncharacterized protein YbjT (DUF2867 family)